MSAARFQYLGYSIIHNVLMLHENYFTINKKKPRRLSCFVKDLRWNLLTVLDDVETNVSRFDSRLISMNILNNLRGFILLCIDEPRHLKTILSIHYSIIFGH